MRQPKVTLLLPTIGRLDFIADTKRSVREQTYADFEAIVLDNASDADARGALTEWAASDSRIRIERVDSRMPMFANFNRGIRAASGEYVAFFHDDDIYHPRLLEHAVQALDRHPAAAFFGCNYDWIDERGQVLESRRWIAQSSVEPGRAYIRKLLRRGRNLVVMPGLVFRRAAIEDGFDENLSMHFGDFTLLMRIAEKWDVFLSKPCDVALRRHVGQASQILPLSVMVPRRTRALLEYCAEYLVRHPSEATFIGHARRRVELQHVTGLCWGWASAPNASEAEACVNALLASSWKPLAKMLDVADTVGLRRALGSARAQVWLRALAGRSGM